MLEGTIVRTFDTGAPRISPMLAASLSYNSYPTYPSYTPTYVEQAPTYAPYSYPLTATATVNEAPINITQNQTQNTANQIGSRFPDMPAMTPGAMPNMPAAMPWLEKFGRNNVIAQAPGPGYVTDGGGGGGPQFNLGSTSRDYEPMPTGQYMDQVQRFSHDQEQLARDDRVEAQRLMDRATEAYSPAAAYQRFMEMQDPSIRGRQSGGFLRRLGAAAGDLMEGFDPRIYGGRRATAIKGMQDTTDNNIAMNQRLADDARMRAQMAEHGFSQAGQGYRGLGGWESGYYQHITPSPGDKHRMIEDFKKRPAPDRNSDEYEQYIRERQRIANESGVPYEQLGPYSDVTEQQKGRKLRNELNAVTFDDKVAIKHSEAQIKKAKAQVDTLLSMTKAEVQLEGQKLRNAHTKLMNQLAEKNLAVFDKMKDAIYNNILGLQDGRTKSMMLRAWQAKIALINAETRKAELSNMIGSDDEASKAMQQNIDDNYGVDLPDLDSLLAMPVQPAKPAATTQATAKPKPTSKPAQQPKLAQPPSPVESMSDGEKKATMVSLIKKHKGNMAAAQAEARAMGFKI